MKLFFFHFRDLRARLELAINKTLELAQKQEEEPQDDQSEFGSDSEEVRAKVKDSIDFNGCTCNDYCIKCRCQWNFYLYVHLLILVPETKDSGGQHTFIVFKYFYRSINFFTEKIIMDHCMQLSYMQFRTKRNQHSQGAIYENCNDTTAKP